MADTTFSAGTVVASTWLQDANDHTYDKGVGTKHASSKISVTPAATITSTNVQAALEELSTTTVPLSGGTLTGHLSTIAGASGAQVPQAQEVGALAVTQRALGTVSQVAGVPTGHILETATNANGTYVKYADGTMICWHRETVTNQAISTAYSSLFLGTRTWTFPATFIADPVVNCGEGKWGTGASWPGSAEFVTTTSASLRFLDAASRASGTSFTFSATAHGRWF